MVEILNLTNIYLSIFSYLFSISLKEKFVFFNEGLPKKTIIHMKQGYLEMNNNCANITNLPPLCMSAFTTP
jgi:hypothetical protein